MTPEIVRLVQFCRRKENHMSDQQTNAEQLRQQLLDQINAQQEAIETLSEEELEAVTGGFMLHIANTVAMPPHFANIHTVAVMPTRRVNIKPGVARLTVE